MPVTLLKRGPSTGAKYKIFNSTFFKEYLWAPFFTEYLYAAFRKFWRFERSVLKIIFWLNWQTILYKERKQ